MFKPSLGLGTKLGAAANKPDLNVRLSTLHIFTICWKRKIYARVFGHIHELLLELHICDKITSSTLVHIISCGPMKSLHLLK